MTIEGMGPVEKLHFLDTLIKKTNHEYRDHFYALYIVFGDDLFLIFSILSGLNFQWPDVKDFRSAQIATKSLGERKVVGTTKTGKAKTVTVPHTIKYLDLSAMTNLTFIHMETKAITPPREIQKFENYYCEQEDEIIYPLSGVRQILGRDWLLYASEFKSIELPDQSMLYSDEGDDEPDDFLNWPAEADL